MTCRMLSIKKRLLSPLFCTKYLISCRDVRCYNTIKRLGKYSSDFVQNFAEKKEEYCGVVQMQESEHTTKKRDVSSDSEAMLLFFGCSKFSVRVYNTSDIPTGQTFAIN